MKKITFLIIIQLIISTTQLLPSAAGSNPSTKAEEKQNFEARFDKAIPLTKWVDKNVKADDMEEFSHRLLYMMLSTAMKEISGILKSRDKKDNDAASSAISDAAQKLNALLNDQNNTLAQQNAQYEQGFEKALENVNLADFDGLYNASVIKDVRAYIAVEKIMKNEYPQEYNRLKERKKSK